jgi:restriction system protein
LLKDQSGDIETGFLQKLIDNLKRQTADEGGDNENFSAAGDSVTSGDDPSVDPEDVTPDEQIANAFNQSREKLADELLVRIGNESYLGFEMLVLDLLRKMGYGEPEHTGKSGDGGIDGIINQDALGLEKVYVQAKRWASQVGEPEIRNFSGSLDPHGATKGVFITTSTFSNTARQTAQIISAGNKFIRLVDGNELALLMIRHSVGVVTEYTYEIKKLDENYFAEEY